MQKLTFYKRIAQPILYIVDASLEIETYSVEIIEIYSHHFSQKLREINVFITKSY